MTVYKNPHFLNFNFYTEEYEKFSSLPLWKQGNQVGLRMTERARWTQQVTVIKVKRKRAVDCVILKRLTLQWSQNSKKMLTKLLKETEK
jgi:hypothetical protein